MDLYVAKLLAQPVIGPLREGGPVVHGVPDDNWLGAGDVLGEEHVPGRRRVDNLAPGRPVLEIDVCASRPASGDERGRHLVEAGEEALADLALWGEEAVGVAEGEAVLVDKGEQGVKVGCEARVRNGGWVRRRWGHETLARARRTRENKVAVVMPFALLGMARVHWWWRRGGGVV